MVVAVAERGLSDLGAAEKARAGKSRSVLSSFIVKLPNLVE
jgi:hypothetical protein